jgi:DnaK suppressor protein
MEHEHARQLLAGERARIEDGLTALGDDPPLESDQRIEPGDRDDEDLYLDELAAARREQLRQELEALERAEDRLASGTYGLSIESGQPIPDARLEALPLAERTVEEDEQYRRGTAP